MRRLATLVALFTAGFLLAACGQMAPGSQAADPPVPDPTPTAEPEPSAQGEELEDVLAWEPCDERFECATVTVPVDHVDPSGATIDLSVIRLPAPPAADRIGAVVVNPGGPGASGVDFVWDAAVEAFPAEVRTRFDIVGFDPRGVGESAPLVCTSRSEDLLRGGFAPQGPGEWAELTEAVRTFGAGCEEASGGLLAHVSTEHVVADLDLLREALGESRLTYVGFSYGTRIGALYAARYPDRVRAMVLDGAVDPALDGVSAARDHALALEEAFERFLAECADDLACPLGADGDPGVVYDRVRAAVLDGALQAVSDAGARTVSATELHLTVAGLLRDREVGWPWLALALAAADEGHGSAITGFVDAVFAGEAEGRTDELAALWAVNCSDTPVPAAGDFAALADDIMALAPRFGLTTLALELPCATWPVAPDAEPARVAAEGSPPIIVIGVTGDPVTPFQWSESLADQLDAVLVTRDGARHTGFGGGNVCTDRAVSRYLIDLVLPSEGWTCG